MARITSSFKVSHLSDLSKATIKLIRNEYGRGDFTGSNNEEVEDLFRLDNLRSFLEEKRDNPEERMEGYDTADYEQALEEIWNSDIAMVAPDYISIDSVD